MTTLDLILLCALAFVLVVSIVLLFVQQGRSARAKADLSARYEAEKSGLATRYEAEKASLVRDYEAARDVLQEKVAAVQSEKAALESRLEARKEYEAQLQQHNEEVRKQAEQQREKDLRTMQQVFENLSARNSETFKARSAETIAELMKPVQEKFDAFSQAVNESRKDSIERHSRLEQRINDLDERSRSVGDEARNLANALTGYSKVQGDFGEMVLVDILKNAGLTEGVHFFTQGVMTDPAGHEIKSEEGRTLIPDVMVFYPDDTTVIIDSKVSLKDYTAYMASTTVEERTALAKAHVESVRRHVDELKDKDYASYIPKDRRKVNYNIMFIPVEGAFRLMLEEDQRLWQVAKDNNVLIVSQMTLIIVLNMIQMSWKQHRQEENIAKVYGAAEELMSQLKGWMDNYVDLGNALQKASKAYEDATSKLRDSNQSVIRKIDKLEKLGLAPKRSRGKIKTSSRLAAPGSIIPPELAPLSSETEEETPEINPTSSI